MVDLPTSTAICQICRQPFTADDIASDNTVTVRSRQFHPMCYAPYVDESNLKLLVNCRCWSLGDTLTMTPAIRELRRLYPKAEIAVISNFPEIFKHSPYVNKNFDRKQVLPSDIKKEFTRTVDLFTGDFQHHWASHSVDFSAKSGLSKSLLPQDMQLELNYVGADRQAMLKIVRPGKKEKIVLLHPHKTEWDTRNWGHSRMPALAEKIKNAYPDHRLISIGGSRFNKDHQRSMKNFVELPGVESLYDKLSLLETAALMDLPQVRLLVTPDTGTLHIGATRPELPIVGIFTLIRSHFRAPVRQGRTGFKFYPVETSGCSCTYDGKPFIEHMDLSTCPKGNFLLTTLASGLEPKEKIVGLSQKFPETIWREEGLEQQIAEETKKYRSGNLRCFPDVQKVFDACKVVLDDRRGWKFW